MSIQAQGAHPPPHPLSRCRAPAVPTHRVHVHRTHSSQGSKRLDDAAAAQAPWRNKHDNSRRIANTDSVPWRRSESLGCALDIDKRVVYGHTYSERFCLQDLGLLAFLHSPVGYRPAFRFSDRPRLPKQAGAFCSASEIHRAQDVRCFLFCVCVS